jgi:hypothetical protein
LRRMNYFPKSRILSIFEFLFKVRLIAFCRYFIDVNVQNFRFELKSIGDIIGLKNLP